MVLNTEAMWSTLAVRLESHGRGLRLAAHGVANRDEPYNRPMKLSAGGGRPQLIAGVSRTSWSR